jgi:membrane protein DedA with SNARE-associated domain
VPLLIGVTYHFGDHIEAGIKLARKVQNGIVLVILAIIVLLVAKHFVLKRRLS